MTPTYSDHIDRAHLAAALAVTMSPPEPGLDAVRQLHDDVVTVLGEATRLICLSSLGEPRAERERAGIPAAQELAAQLAVYPRLGPTGQPSSPSERWSTRPTELTAEITALDAWKILAAETFLARACLDPMERRLTTPLRGAVLTDLAALAGAVATATADLGPAGAPAPDHVLAKARALAAAADRVQRDATVAVAGTDRAAMPLVSAARERRQVQLVRGHADIAAALGNLARLTSTGPPHAPEMFATTIMLATVAESVAAALEAGQARPGSLSRTDRQATAALAEYRHQLTRVVRKHQPKLASFGPGNPAALAQARELRTAGVPRLEALALDPTGARTATGDLRRIAAALAPATAAVRSAFAALEARGGLLAYDWAPGPGFHWRMATKVDALPLLHGLDAATRTAAALRPDRSALSPASLQPTPRQGATAGRIVDLTEAIDRRRADLARQAHVPDGSLTAPSALQASLTVPTQTRDRAEASPVMR